MAVAMSKFFYSDIELIGYSQNSDIVIIHPLPFGVPLIASSRILENGEQIGSATWDERVSCADFEIVEGCEALLILRESLGKVNSFVYGDFRVERAVLFEFPKDSRHFVVFSV
jgi:hypothetical protein